MKRDQLVNVALVIGMGGGEGGGGHFREQE